MAEPIDELLVRLGLETDAKGFREASNLFSGLRTKALITGGAIGGAFAGMAKISDGVAKSRDSLAKWADTANVSTKRAQELAYALKQVGGSESDAMAMLDNVNRLRDQAMKGELSAWAFEGMEFDVSAIQSMGAEEALDYLIRNISDISNPDRQRRVAGELGFSSPAALAVVTNADRTFSDYRRAGELGGIADQDLFDKSAAYTGALTELEQAAQGLKDIVAGQLLPGMTELVEGITGFAVENREEFAEFLKEAMPYLKATATGIGLLVAAQVGARAAKFTASSLAKYGPAVAVGALVEFYSDEDNRKKAGATFNGSLNYWGRNFSRWTGIGQEDDPSQALPEKPEGWADEDVPWWPDAGAPGVDAEPPSGESLLGSSTTTVTVPITVDARGATDPAAVEAAARRGAEGAKAEIARLANTAMADFPRNVQ